MRALILAVAVFGLAGCALESATPAGPQQGARTELATVDAPQAGAAVSSPLRVSGTAPADWYFENQFSASIVGADGALIAEAPAHPRVNWTEPGPKQYDAELTFDAEGPAFLVLEESMPGEGETPRQVRVPIMLTR